MRKFITIVTMYCNGYTYLGDGEFVERNYICYVNGQAKIDKHSIVKHIYWS